MEILTLNLIGKGESSPFSLSRLLRELRGGTWQNIELQKRPTYKFTGSIYLNYINLKVYIKFYLEIIILNDVVFGTNLRGFEMKRSLFQIYQ